MNGGQDDLGNHRTPGWIELWSPNGGQDGLCHRHVPGLGFCYVRYVTLDARTGTRGSYPRAGDPERGASLLYTPLLPWYVFTFAARAPSARAPRAARRALPRAIAACRAAAPPPRASLSTDAQPSRWLG